MPPGLHKYPNELSHRMKNYFLHREELERDLNSLSPVQRTAFAAVIAERLLPVYDNFFQEFHWGKPELFRRVMTFLWDYVRNGVLDRNRVAELIADCLANAPDMDEFADDGRVLGVCTAILSALKATIDPTAKSAREAAIAAQETVADFDVADPVLPKFKQRLAEGLPLQRELQSQAELVNELRRHEKFDERKVRNIRERFVFGM